MCNDFNREVCDMNILLLGDSIRMFYSEEVVNQLGEGYKVYFPNENCRFSAYMLNSLRHWLPQFPKPDIIHWNAGLWDVARLYKEDGCFIKKAEYVNYMTKILRELKKTGALIIFATTTPVSDKKQYFEGPVPPANKNEDIMAYNEAILDAFKGENIIINDLFGIMYPQREKYLSEDMVHPNEAGVKLLGSAVSDVIKNCGIVKNDSGQCLGEIIPIEEKKLQ